LLVELVAPRGHHGRAAHREAAGADDAHLVLGRAGARGEVRRPRPVEARCGTATARFLPVAQDAARVEDLGAVARVARQHVLRARRREPAGGGDPHPDTRHFATTIVIFIAGWIAHSTSTSPSLVKVTLRDSPCG